MYLLLCMVIIFYNGWILKLILIISLWLSKTYFINSFNVRNPLYPPNVILTKNIKTSGVSHILYLLLLVLFPGFMGKMDKEISGLLSLGIKFDFDLE